MMYLRAPFVALATLLFAVCATGKTQSLAAAAPPAQRVLSPHVSSAPAFKYERIDKTNAVLLVVDLQEGLYQISRDQSAVQMKNNILAHAALGKVFGLPTILTTSAETGS